MNGASDSANPTCVEWSFSFLHVSVAKLDEKNIHTESIKLKHKEFLDSWNPLVFLKNPSRVAEVKGHHVVLS